MDNAPLAFSLVSGKQITIDIIFYFVCALLWINVGTCTVLLCDSCRCLVSFHLSSSCMTSSLCPTFVFAVRSFQKRLPASETPDKEGNNNPYFYENHASADQAEAAWTNVPSPMEAMYKECYTKEEDAPNETDGADNDCVNCGTEYGTNQGSIRSVSGMSNTTSAACRRMALAMENRPSPAELSEVEVRRAGWLGKAKRWSGTQASFVRGVGCSGASRFHKRGAWERVFAGKRPVTIRQLTALAVKMILIAF